MDWELGRGANGITWMPNMNMGGGGYEWKPRGCLDPQFVPSTVHGRLPEDVGLQGSTIHHNRTNNSPTAPTTVTPTSNGYESLQALTCLFVPFHI